MNRDWHIQLIENVGMQTNEQVTMDFVNMIIDYYFTSTAFIYLMKTHSF